MVGMEGFVMGVRKAALCVSVLMLVLHSHSGQAASPAPVSWDASLARGEVRDIDFVVTEGTGMSVDISPDGKWLVFDLLAHIYRVPADGGGEAEVLTQASGVALNYHPRYSPDGKSIVFVSDRGGQSNLWLMNSDGSNPRLLFDAPDHSFVEPSWTADGRAILAVRHAPHALGIWTRANRIWMIPIDGSPPRELAGSDSTLVFSPSASPDGRYVYYHKTSGPVVAEGYYKVPTNHQLRRITLATGRDEPVDVTPERRYYHREALAPFAPRISPDGRYLAFARRIPDGRTEHKGAVLTQQTALWVRDLATGEERIIADRLPPDQLETHTMYQIRMVPGFSWARDSGSIVYAEGGRLKRSSLSGKTEIIPFSARVHRVISERVRARLRLEDGPVSIRAPRWPAISPEGRLGVFEAAGSLWRKPIGSGVPKRLIDEKTWGDRITVELSAAWSPDGRWIAFTTWTDEEGGTLWKMPAAGGKPMRLSRAPGNYLHPAWSPDGREIVVARGSGGALRGDGTGGGAYQELVRFPAKGGEGTALIRLGAANGFVRASFGSDGRIYFASDVEPGDKATDRRIGVVLRSMNADGADIRAHAGFQGNTAVAVSRDGRHIALTEAENLFLLPMPQTEALHYFASDTPAQGVARLTTKGGLYPSWTLDGRLATFSGPMLTLRNIATGQNTEESINLAIERPCTDGTIAFTNARILTMDNRKVIDRGTILVKGRRIVGLGDVSTAKADRVIDLSGKTVIPGLIDVHVHGSGAGGDEILAPRQAHPGNYLSYGVTTMFDPAVASTGTFARGEQTAVGKLIGPRHFSTGTPMFGAGGYLVKDPAFADDSAARLSAMGAIALKQYYQPRRDQRQWLVEAARKRGDLLVTGEGMDLSYTLGMIMDGQTAWEHPLLDLPLYDDVVQFIAKSGTQYNPELITPGQGLYLIEYYMAEKGPDQAKDPRQQLWVPWTDLYRKTNFTRRPLSEYPAVLSVQGVKEIVRAGGGVGVGSHGQDMGLGTHREIWTFALALDPIEALEAATIVNARYLGMDEDLGSITVGKIADFAVLDADPLTDIRNTTSVRFVMSDGVLYDALTLDQQWPSVRPYGPRRWSSER
jgi:Tol biopolymer transport system component/imidazolonepropionase-like amidohydrolase